MNTRLKLIPLAVVALVAMPAAGIAQKVDQKLSIGAQPKAVTIGKTTSITGQLTGGTAKDISGQNVTLHSDPYPYEGDFAKVATVDTNAQGYYAFTLKPLTNAKYHVTAKGGTQSGDLEVPVRVAVTLKVSDKTPKAGSRVKFSGSVAPPHDGEVARVQRRTKSGWKNIAKAPLTDGGDVVSNFSKRVRITRSGRYRVKFSPSDGDHAAGTSSKVRLRVG